MRISSSSTAQDHAPAAAPQARPLDRLPPDVLGHIAARVAGRSRLHDEQAIRGLCALRATSQALRRAVDTHEHATARLAQGKPLQAILVMARAAADDLLQIADRDPERAHDAADCIWILHLLDPRRQAALVRILLDQRACGGPSLYCSRQLGPAAGDLASRLQHLDESLRAHLVDAAADCRVDGPVDAAVIAWAVGVLGRGLAHLDETQQRRLQSRVTGLRCEKSRATAVREFSAGWVHLPPDQQQALWTAALRIQDPQRADAIRGLCGQFQHLERGQRNHLFDQAIDLADRLGHSQAIAGLAASLAYLSPGQRETLLAATLRLSDSIGWYASIRTLAAGLRHLEPPQRKRLLDAALALTNPFARAHAIAALGQGLEHLEWSQQDRLLQAAASLDANFKTLAIKGLAAGLEFLPSGRRDTVVARVLASDPGDLQADEIGALGLHLQHLREAQRTLLVRQAVRLLEGDRLGQRAARALMTGLGAGLGTLSEDSRRELVDAVARMPRPGEVRALGDPLLAAARGMRMAAAIEGLGPGLARLGGPGCRALMALVAALRAATEDHRPSSPSVATAIQQAVIKAAATLTGIAPGAPRTCV
jgi:hypothetical protein